MGADVARRARRRAVQDDDDLSGDVEPVIIVEAARRQVEAVAGEDQRRRDRQRFRVGARPQQNVGRPGRKLRPPMMRRGVPPVV